MWNTLIQTALSGKERRAQLWSFPRYTFKIKYDYLRDTGTSPTDIQKLIGFYNAMGGAAQNFLFQDEKDNSITGQTIGIGDGTTTAFQLVRDYGGFVEPIFGIASAPTMYLNSSPTLAFTWSTLGLVTFTSPPGVGVVITADFSFYYRVRFAKDTNEFEQFLYDLYQLGTMEIITDKY
jgi:uncharacterized protein (TIGR02217 family)